MFSKKRNPDPDSLLDELRVGDMPRGKQFGYVFTSGDNLNWTIAHELGHGRFKLRHTFDGAYGSGFKDAIDNLMNYTNSSYLAKWQWDEIFDPALLINPFEGDDAGMYSKNVHFGLTPNGQLADGFYLKESNKETKINVTRIITSTSHTISMVKYDGLVYQWDVASKAYKNGAKLIIAKKVSGYPDEVNVFKYENNCDYSYLVIPWTQADEGANDAEALIAKRIAEKVSPIWIMAPATERDPACNENFINDIKKRTTCTEQEVQASDLLLSELKASDDADHVSNIINTSCLASLRKLSYDQLSGYFKKITSLSSLNSASEIALLRLMNAMKSSDYKKFFNLLESENNKLVIHLVKEMDDKSYAFWLDGNNYTNFMGALVSMYKIVSDSYLGSLGESGSDQLLGQIFNLNPQPFKDDFKESIYAMPLNKFRFRGEYNEETGSIKIFRENEIAVYNSNLGGYAGAWVREEGDIPLNPLTPVIIITDNNVPLVQTALDENSINGGNAYLVPAIFLKYTEDKEFQDALEKGAMMSLDVVTIAYSGGTALASKVTWVRRIWAALEVTGAVGNIAVNTDAIKPGDRLYSSVQIYNGAMALIGIKNLAQSAPGATKGMINFAKGLPEKTRNLLKSNGSLRTLLVAEYHNWLTATKDLGKLDNAEQQLISQQEKVWKMLGVAEDVGKGGNTFPSKLPNPNATPKGPRTTILDQMDIETKTSLIRENEGADILAQKGFDIEQNPVIPNTTRNPDYKIEGEVFDCYSPFNSDKNVRGIWTEVRDKIMKGQTERIVLNLKYWNGDISSLQTQFGSYPIDGLKEVIILDKSSNIQYLKL